MRRTALGVLVLGISAMSFVGHSAEPASQRYVAVPAQLGAACGVNAGCFSLSGSESLVLIHDALGGPVGAHFRFKAGSATLSSGAFCGGSELSAPAGATNLEVVVHDVPGCGLGTSGTITLS